MIDKLIEEAKKLDANKMLNIISSSLDMLIDERKNKNALFYLHSKESAIIIGDLHGDLESLHFILKNSKFYENKSYLIFLGDYGDRGLNSAEVYYVVLSLKQEFPKRVVLLRGNHEFLPGLEVWPHNLPLQLVSRFGNHGNKIYQSLRKLWEYFYLASIAKNKYLFLHGGLPVNLRSLKEFEIPSGDILEQTLWNDPAKVNGSYISPRGAGMLFGKDVTKKILNKFRIKTLIRSHQPPKEGVAVSHEGKILTISSTKVYGGKAAYLKLNLKEKAKDAYELSKISKVFKC